MDLPISSRLRSARVRFGIVLIVLTGLGCGGGSPHEIQPSTIRGRLRLAVEVQIDPAIYSRLKSDLGSRLIADGMSFDDANHAIATTARDLGGRWLRLGTTRTMADTHGDFEFPFGVTGRSVDILRDPSGEPESSFPAASLDYSGKTRRTIVQACIHQGVMAMDDGQTSSAPTGCCPSIEDEESPLPGSNRCLDYDGPYGDGLIYPHASYEGVRNYVGSTCWKFVDSGLCTNEGATIWNQITLSSGPSCFANHKYRFCQDITNRFGASPATTAIQDGQSVTFSVTNDTTANETAVSLSGSGSISAALLKHYDDAAKKHIVSRSVTYTASLPKGVNQETVVVLFQAGGITIKATIVVKRHDQGGS